MSTYRTTHWHSFGPRFKRLLAMAAGAALWLLIAGFTLWGLLAIRFQTEGIVRWAVLAAWCSASIAMLAWLAKPKWRDRARWPAIVVIVGLLVAAFLFDGADESTTTSTAPAATFGAVVAKTDSLSALWFCNGGTAVDNGIADHRVILVNTTDAVRTGSLTAYASKPAQGARPAPVRVTWTLAPHARAEYRLADVVGKAPYASATIEVAGGGVLVEHRAVGTAGDDSGPCASSASGTWYVPIGTTATVGDAPIARELLVFFNPVPGDAVVDVAFSTDTGFRGTPEVFKGLVVPGGAVVGVDGGLLLY